MLSKSQMLSGHVYEVVYYGVLASFLYQLLLYLAVLTY